MLIDKINKVNFTSRRVRTPLIVHFFLLQFYCAFSGVLRLPSHATRESSAPRAFAANLISHAALKRLCASTRKIIIIINIIINIITIVPSVVFKPAGQTLVDGVAAAVYNVIFT